jgi:hypothetical protein
MNTPTRTAVRELIDRLNGATTVEKAEKAFYEALDIERRIIATAYDAAMNDINQDVRITGLEYYDKVFTNQE